MFPKLINFYIAAAFFSSLIGPIPKAQAQPLLGLPEPGAMVNLSPAYQPAILKGVTVHKENPFLFDFIVDVGENHLEGEALKKEGEKLIKYFLASLAIPEKDLWVNLSPYEKDRIIPEALSRTEMGRDLLAQDYLLKQITASLIYPEKELGKAFWDKVYAKAQQMYGTSQVPVNTFNKVWIMADKAEVFERNQTAFVVSCHLKVMLEEDYLATQKNGQANKPLNPKAPQVNNLSKSILKEIILPELEKEINTGKHFAPLRQITHSLILASWYKKNLKQAILNQVYAGRNKVKGIDLKEAAVKEKIYARYVQAYKKGVFNFVKEDHLASQSSPRKYFSGGWDAAMAADPVKTNNTALLAAATADRELVSFETGMIYHHDHAMTISPGENLIREFFTNIIVPEYTRLVAMGHNSAVDYIARRLSQKKDTSPVTYFDQYFERQFHSIVLKYFPDDAIYGEEYGARAGKGWTWTIDPIDGTKSFVKLGDKNEGHYFGTLVARYDPAGWPQIAAGYFPLLQLQRRTGLMIFAHADQPGIEINGERRYRARMATMNRSKTVWIGSNPAVPQSMPLVDHLTEYFSRRGYKVKKSVAGGGEVLDMILNGRGHLFINLDPFLVDNPVDALFAMKLGLIVSDHLGNPILPINPAKFQIANFTLKSLVIGTVQSYREAMAAFKAIGADANAAMSVKYTSAQGGIDLNTQGVQWKTGKEGKGAEMDIDPAMIERIRRDGIESLTPVIFRITPIASIWPIVLD